MNDPRASSPIDRDTRVPALLAVCLAALSFIALAALIGPELSPHRYDQISAKQLQTPSFEHWAGTDLHGRDVFTRTLVGARFSLLVGIIGAGVSLVVGVIYGMISGYFGGKIDMLMMRFVDVLFSLPRLIIVILLIAVFDGYFKDALEWASLDALVPHTRLLLLFVGLGLVEWLTMARIVRGEVLSLKERAFVQASVSLGQSHAKILILHLWPNIRGIVIIYMTLTVPAVILEESFLSFLGLGVQAPQSSWGTLLSEGVQLINPIKTTWWMVIAPGLMMAVTLLALNFLGDALRDRWDPKRGRL